MTILPNGKSTNQNLSWKMRHKKIHWDSDIKTDHLFPIRRPNLVIVNKNRTSRVGDVAVPTDRRVKIKENKKKDRARELKKTVILIITGARGTITKDLVRRLEGLEIGSQAETRILKRVLVTWGDFLTLGLY